jgi:hypothetical protein
MSFQSPKVERGAPIADYEADQHPRIIQLHIFAQPILLLDFSESLGQQTGDHSCYGVDLQYLGLATAGTYRHYLSRSGTWIRCSLPW